jgi:AcrR family transcriptional regulator
MPDARTKSIAELLGLPDPPKTGRERLIAAAVDLFYRNGFGAVGIDQVIASAGVTKTTFYKHFESKDELMVAAVQRRDEWESAAWGRAIQKIAGDDPARQLIAMFDVMDIWFNDPDFRGCMFMNTAAEFPNPHDPVHQAAAAYKRRARDHWRDLARSAGAAVSASETFADCYTAMIEGALILRQIHGRNDAARAVRPAVEQLISVYLPRAEQSSRGGNARKKSAVRSAVASFLIAMSIHSLAVFAKAERPNITALRVSDNVIVVDGRDDDWQRLGNAAMERSRAASSEKQWTPMYVERGIWAGPDDCSIVAHVAADSENLYVIADVHDEFLANSATPTDPYIGDDFEMFIEAASPESRFARASENYRHIIVVPGRVNLQWPKPFIWQAEQNPGVVAATRMRPWGYTVEVKMPKSLWPYWKDHPDLESIGFDAMACEADAPGIDIAHPSLKGAMFLMAKGLHYQTPADIGQANFEKDVSPFGAAVDNGPVDEAQTVLDAEESDHAAQIAAAALESENPDVRNAGLIVLAQRSDLDAPIDRIISLLTPTPPPPRAGAAAASTALVILDRAAHVRRAIPRYAMMALAERHKMPAVDLFDVYGKPTDDPAIRLTYLWFVGINGDRAVAPKLITLLSDPNLRIRLMTAMTLGKLGDPAAIEPLRALSKTDPWDAVKAQTKLSIEQIERQSHSIAH